MSFSNKITFYFDPLSRSQVVFRMLEEVNAHYEMKFISIIRNEQKSSEYLKINPMGKVPAIVHQGTVITEVAAICLYLADIFPEAELAPAIGDPRRGSYYRWMFFATNCFEPAIFDYHFPRSNHPPETSIGYGNFNTMMNTLKNAVKSGFLLGDQFSTPDLYLSSYLEWFFFQKYLPEDEILMNYMKRCMDRPRTKIYKDKRKSNLKAS